MKRIICILLTLIMVFSLVGCGNDVSNSFEVSEISVLEWPNMVTVSGKVENKTNTTYSWILLHFEFEKGSDKWEQTTSVFDISAHAKESFQMILDDNRTDYDKCTLISVDIK